MTLTLVWDPRVMYTEAEYLFVFDVNFLVYIWRPAVY